MRQVFVQQPLGHAGYSAALAHTQVFVHHDHHLGLQAVAHSTRLHQLDALHAAHIAHGVHRTIPDAQRRVLGDEEDGDTDQEAD